MNPKLMKVAIHQPNYFPWMGYFKKIFLADVFIFLDDVQFSKGSYINRVRISSSKGIRWLTLPVKVKLGQNICDVKTSRDNWQVYQIDLLRNAYSKAKYKTKILPELEEELFSISSTSISEININIIKMLASRLDIQTSFLRSSEINSSGKGDDRLINLVKSVRDGATYLSGRGGENYQNPKKFSDAGLGLEYIEFEPPEYNQGEGEFESGLSIVDCLMMCGWEKTGKLICN